MSLPAPADVLAEAARAVRAEGRAMLCHVVRTEGSTPGKPGWRLLLRRDGTAYGNLGGGAFEALVKTDAASRLARGAGEGEDGGAGGGEVKRYYLTESAVKGEATGMVCGGMIEVFLELLMANPMLVLCGGGPVGQALAQAGALAGFDLLVVEDRDEFRRPELFPPGTEIAAADRDFAGDFLAPWAGRELYVAVVSRCWETDVGALAGVLRQAPPNLRYLGLMGSRRKVERVVAEVEGQGLSLDGIPFAAPIGLPLGGDTPGEIAIAVLAEILTTRYESRRNHAA